MIILTRWNWGLVFLLNDILNMVQCVKAVKICAKNSYWVYNDK